MPEYMANRPVDLLIAPGLEAADFNDDTLGRALEELQYTGVTDVFARVAAEALRAYDIEVVYTHLDSTTFAVHGAYDSAYATRMVEDYGAVEIRRGIIGQT